MRLLAVAVPMVFASLAACEKAPPEPVAPSHADAREPARAREPKREVGERKQRCMRPTPEAPPPPAIPLAPGACPKDPERAPPMVPVGHVEFVESETAPRIEVELMLNDAHRARGMMYRTSLADDRGMLFAWRQPDFRSFWMRDTCLSLDMLFIDADGYIAGIVENVPPMNDDGRGIDCPVSYVLEVNAGFARKHGIVAGQRVKIDGLAW